MGKSNSKKLKDEQKKFFEKFCFSYSQLLNMIFSFGSRKEMQVSDFKFLKKEEEMNYLSFFQNIILEIISEDDRLKEIYRTIKFVEFEIFSVQEQKFFLEFLFKFYKFLLEISSCSKNSRGIIKDFLRKFFEDSDKKIKFNLVHDVNIYMINMNSEQLCLFSKLIKFWEEKENLKSKSSPVTTQKFFQNLKEMIKKLSYLIFTPNIFHNSKFLNESEEDQSTFKLVSLIGKQEKLSWISNDSIFNFFLFKFFENDKNFYNYGINFWIFQLEIIDKISPNGFYFIVMNIINFLLCQLCMKKKQDNYLVMTFTEIEYENFFLNNNENDQYLFQAAEKYQDDLFNFHREFLYYFNYIVTMPCFVKFKFFIDKDTTLQNLVSFVKLFERVYILEMIFSDEIYKNDNFKILFANVSLLDIEPLDLEKQNITSLNIPWMERKLTYISSNKNYNLFLKRSKNLLFLKFELFFDLEQAFSEEEEINNLNFILTNLNYQNVSGLYVKIFTNFDPSHELFSKFFESFYSNYKSVLTSVEEHLFSINNIVLKFQEKNLLNCNEQLKKFVSELCVKINEKVKFEELNFLIYEENEFYTGEFIKNFETNAVFISINRKFLLNLNFYLTTDIGVFLDILPMIMAEGSNYFSENLLIQNINIFIDFQAYSKCENPSKLFNTDNLDLSQVLAKTSFYFVDKTEELFFAYFNEQKALKVYFSELENSKEKINLIISLLVTAFCAENVGENESLVLKLVFSEFKGLKKPEIELFDFLTQFNESSDIQFDIVKDTNICLRFPLLINNVFEEDNLMGEYQYEFFQMIYDLFLNTFKNKNQIKQLINLTNLKKLEENLYQVVRKSSIFHSFHNLGGNFSYQSSLFKINLIHSFSIEFDHSKDINSNLEYPVNYVSICGRHYLTVKEIYLLSNGRVLNLDVLIEEDLTIGKEKINNIAKFGEVFENYNSFLGPNQGAHADNLVVNFNLIGENSEYTSNSNDDSKFVIFREKFNIIFTLFRRMTRNLVFKIKLNPGFSYIFEISKIKDMLEKVQKEEINYKQIHSTIYSLTKSPKEEFKNILKSKKIISNIKRYLCNKNLFNYEIS